MFLRVTPERRRLGGGICANIRNDCIYIYIYLSISYRSRDVTPRVTDLPQHSETRLELLRTTLGGL